MQEKQEKLGMRDNCGETNALQRNNFEWNDEWNILWRFSSIYGFW